ncbi:MAG: hypothetical protein JO048_03015 [Methylobacteriaceae bacterium]|nr:hypothetical protein [Methylobacteriaceae bacterium]
MPNDALTVQLIQWIGPEPRSYRDTMEAWRTSCPRLSIFEDAMSAGLIERVAGASLADAQVRVTEAGRRHLGPAPARP